MRRLIALVGAVLLGAQALGAQALGAQVQAKQVELGAHAGLQVFSKGTALENTPFVGMAATRELPWNPLSSLIPGSSLSVGLLLDVSRPLTRGDQFEAVTIDAGDTTFLYTVAQRVTLMQGGVEAVFGALMGPMRVYGFAGAGVYFIGLAPRSAAASERITHPMVTFGGGVAYSVGERLSLRAQLRAVTFTKFDRALLDAGTPYVRDPRFRDAVPAPDATSARPTNVQLSLAVQYIPGGR